MNLEILRDYFAFLAEAEQTLARHRQSLAHLNAFSFYTLLAPKTQPAVDSQMLIHFISSFTYNFQVPQLEQLLKRPNFQLHPEDQRLSREQLMSHGVELFLKRYSTTGALNFYEFSLFLKEQEEMPQRTGELSFPLKKQFYQLLQDEIQNLLDAEAFRKAVALHYRNLDDLFELVSCDGAISQLQVSNLFLGMGQRKSQDFLELLKLRFPMPMDESTFRRWFAVTTNTYRYKQQTKIYYSSVKRKKYEFRGDDEEGKFTTPGKRTAAAGTTSTKMTKAERLSSLKRTAIEISRFVTEQAPEAPGAVSQAEILPAILGEQERVNEMKRQLLYQPDYDLELIYEKRGAELQGILNKKYGSCNFTSFVRFIVPQDYEHRYYAFIKYNKQNSLSATTSRLLDELIEAETRKQERIQEWWRGLDREMVFRGYCSPGQKGITYDEVQLYAIQLSKYFTGRECKLLLDRFDPHKMGLINYDYFA